MTRAILRAQFWELWRVTRFELLVRVLLPLAFLGVLEWSQSPMDSFLARLAYTGVFAAAVTSTLWVRSIRHDAQVSYPFPLHFARPVSAPWLVAIPILWLLLTNAAVYSVLVVVSRGAFGLDFPLLAAAPAVLFATIALACAAWGGGIAAVRASIALLSFIALSWVQLWLLPEVFDVDSAIAHGLAAPEASRIPRVFMIAGLPVCAAVLVGLVRRQRSASSTGRFPEPVREVDWSRDAVYRAPVLDTPGEAQTWLELRRALPRLRVALAGGVSLLAVTTLLAESGLWPLTFFGSLLWALLMVSTPPFLLVSAASTVSGVSVRHFVSCLSPFEATQPISEFEAVRRKMGTVVRVALPGLAIFAAAASVSTLVMFDGSLFAIIGGENLAGAILNTVVGLLLLLVVCLTAALLTLGFLYAGTHSKGRRMLFFSGVLVSSPVLVLVLESVTRWELDLLRHTCLALVGVALLCSTGCALWRVWSDGHFGTRNIVFMVAGWESVVLLIGVLYPTILLGMLQAPPGVLLFDLGLLCVPIFSITWTPLSLAAARHQ